MPRRLLKHLEDIAVAIHEIESFCVEKTFSDFQHDRQLQVAIERELEIIGEALYRVRNTSEERFAQIPDAEKIIGLRNILAHGYDCLDYEILWDIVSNKLTNLNQETAKLEYEIIASESDQTNSS